ncbi:MAG TPA: universal stress protein [Terriglobia bacterium]|nr:universal stress protein [Terriglobia bacterium]
MANFVEENGIDLIVMSTHGRSGLPRFFIGSVTDRVIRFSHVPVLAIPPEE